MLTSRLASSVALASLLASLANCQAASSSDPVDSTAASSIGTSSEALQVEAGPSAVAYDFEGVTFSPAGVAGSADTVFVGSPLDGRVIASSRITGKQIGELPPPPGGFGLPFIMHMIGPNKVAVLDAGGLPQPLPFVPSHPQIYEYTFTNGLRGFSATLTRTVSFDAVTIGFPEDILYLPDGRYLITDSILGALYVANNDGSIQPLIAPKSFDPADRLPIYAFCPTMPQVTVNGIPFLFSGSTNPGISPLALRNGTLYFYSPCGGGLFSLPFAGLFDRRTPQQRAGDARMVSPKPANVQVEELLGITFNPYAPDEPYLYAADALQLRIIRVDVRTGKRDVIANDPKLFDFPSSLAFLPPVVGPAPLLVVSNQQERITFTNDAISTSAPNLPFVVAKVYTWTGLLPTIAP